MAFSDHRLGEIIAACHQALRRPDLDPRVRARVKAILATAQQRARLLLGEGV